MSRTKNPDHNIWSNNGTYWCDYTIYDTPRTKKRIRVSLHTKSIEDARRKRDKLMREAAAGNTLARSRGQAMPDVTTHPPSESRAVRPRLPLPLPGEPMFPAQPAAPVQPERKPWWKAWIDAAMSFLGLRGH